MKLPFAAAPRLRRLFALSAAVPGLCVAGSAAAQSTARIMEQDPTLNNLIDPPGYAVGVLGELGHVEKSGHGAQTMILIPGLGFGGEVFDGFMEGWDETLTKYTVTLPGMDGTPAPPSAPEGESFGAQRWTHAAAGAVAALMEEEGLQDVVLVGHWITGTQIALRVAAEESHRVRAVILPAGSARWVTAEPTPDQPDSIPVAQRAARVDQYLAPQWFKTVTRETWDDNNFLPGDYAAHPVLGLRLWRQAASPRLHVWIRYLNEFFAQDATFGLAELAVPTLLLKPGLEGVFSEPGNNYVHAYLDRGGGDGPAGAETSGSG